MASTTTMKRSAPDGTNTASKRIKTEGDDMPAADADVDKKACILCTETDTTFPKVSVNCKGKHSNDICKLCWTKYINTKLFADPTGGTKCVQCPAQLSYAEVKKITGGKNYSHYDFLVRRAQAEKEGLRECLGDVTDQAGHKITCHYFQPHDEEREGRVFQCKKCSNRECVRCSIHEHDGEACEAFQARLKAKHCDEEAQTAAAFQTGYLGREIVGQNAVKKEKIKLPKPCPACGVWIERQEKCPHMTCLKCGNQFCHRCNAPYFGKNSVPELGNKAHQPYCTYYKREKEDRRFKRKVKSEVADEDRDGHQEPAGDDVVKKAAHSSEKKIGAPMA